MATDGGDAEKVIAEFRAAGIDDAELAGKLQRDGAAKFVKSWNDLLGRIGQKAAARGGKRPAQGARA